MAAKSTLTNEAIALTEKKIDMTLDDIIKMSKKPVSKDKTQRIANKGRDFINNGATQAQARTSNLKRFMNSRSALRQGVLAQRRTNFKGKIQFPLAAEAARKAANVPVSMRFPISRKSRPWVQTRSEKVSSYPAKVVRVATQKQGPQTLDSLFANMKEQRLMRAKGIAPSGRPFGRQARFPRNGNSGNDRTRPSR